MKIEGGDFVFIALIVVMAHCGTLCWLVAILPIVLHWFFAVTWENKAFVWRRR